MRGERGTELPLSWVGPRCAVERQADPHTVGPHGRPFTEAFASDPRRLATARKRVSTRRAQHRCLAAARVFMSLCL
jgi:hypothetical protein